MPEKFTRKELRGPDAFQKAGFELRQWLQERQTLVALVVLLIFLSGAGAAVASYVSSRGEVQASQQLSAALRTVERPVSANESQPERLESQQPFGSQQAKDEALVKELSEVAQKYPRSRAAVTAMLPLGVAQLRLGRAEQARAS
ncbi:MAG TPA: tetratricopeptide repeat protein, partial [Myxococcaceae bacterium]|nr:tetratricopeptide repeat protein [Myxococcaceae bacterium]